MRLLLSWLVSDFPFSGEFTGIVGCALCSCVGLLDCVVLMDIGPENELEVDNFDSCKSSRNLDGWSSSVSVSDHDEFLAGKRPTIPEFVEFSRIEIVDFLTNRHPNPDGFSPNTL